MCAPVRACHATACSIDPYDLGTQQTFALDRILLLELAVTLRFRFLPRTALQGNAVAPGVTALPL
jgi:hypothetical protein